MVLQEHTKTLVQPHDLEHKSVGFTADPPPNKHKNLYSHIKYKLICKFQF